jgi:hypothetical protein
LWTSESGSRGHSRSGSSSISGGGQGEATLAVIIGGRRAWTVWMIGIDPLQVNRSHAEVAIAELAVG